MNEKKKGIILFYGIEQGLGKNEKHAHASFKGTMATEARDWIRKKCSDDFKIKNKEEYATSLLVITREEENYHNELNDCILDRMNVIAINPQKEKRCDAYCEVVTEKSDNNE